MTVQTPFGFETATAGTATATTDSLLGARFTLPTPRRGTASRFRTMGEPLPAGQLRSAVLGYALQRSGGRREGVVPSWHELGEHLRDAGFADADVTDSGLSRAVSAAAGVMGEAWCVPVAGLPGRRDALAFRAVGADDEPWQTAECGEIAGPCEQIVLVGCPREAAALADAGLTEVRCVAGLAGVERGFWEDLALRGVERVTLLGCAANGAWDAMASAADAARAASSTPAVSLHELPAECGRSAVGELERVGLVAFRGRLFGEDAPATVPMPAPQGFDASAFWAAVRPEIASIHEPMQRRAHERLAVEVCEQLRVGRPEAAKAALAGGPQRAAMLPGSVSHHVETVRSHAAAAAMAKRIFDVLRATGGRVAVATPMSHDAFLDFAAAAAVGHGQHPQLAGRSQEQLRQELEALGHRLHVVTLAKPHESDAAQAGLFRDADCIVLDLTDQTQMLWWEQNGCCGRMTRLAEAADADLVAFWPAAASRTAPPVLRDDVVGLLRGWCER